MYVEMCAKKEIKTSLYRRTLILERNRPNSRPRIIHLEFSLRKYEINLRERGTSDHLTPREVS